MKEKSKLQIVRAASWALQRHVSNPSNLSSYQVNNLRNQIKLYSTNYPNYSLPPTNTASIKIRKKKTQTRGHHHLKTDERLMDSKGVVRDLLGRMELAKKIVIKIILEKGN